MKLNDYQNRASVFADLDELSIDPLLYLTIGVTGESGEIAEKVKKMLRNDNGKLSQVRRQALQHELGDVLWYVSQLARVLGVSLEDVARANLEKLADREARGVMKSEGDDR